MGVSHDIADMLTCDVNYPLLLSHNFCIFSFKIIVSPIYTNWCFLMTSVFFLRAKPINYSSLGGCGLHLGEVKSLRPLNCWDGLYVFVLYSFWVLLFIVFFSCGIEVALKFSRMLFKVPGRKKNQAYFPSLYGIYAWVILNRYANFLHGFLMLICCFIFSVV